MVEAFTYYNKMIFHTHFIKFNMVIFKKWDFRYYIKRYFFFLGFIFAFYKIFVERL